MQLKKSMRTHFRQLRNELTDQERMRASEAIARRLRSIPEVAAAQSLITYVSTGTEVNTHGIIADALRAGIAVYTPIVEGNSMCWNRLRNFSNLNLVSLEPDPRKRMMEIPPADAPVLIPALAIDRSGNRLGQGGGHFDRFLATHRGPKIAIVFAIQVTDELPREEHDVPMDYLITETTSIRFTN